MNDVPIPSPTAWTGTVDGRAWTHTGTGATVFDGSLDGVFVVEQIA